MNPARLANQLPDSAPTRLGNYCLWDGSICLTNVKSRCDLWTLKKIGLAKARPIFSMPSSKRDRITGDCGSRVASNRRCRAGRIENCQGQKFVHRQRVSGCQASSGESRPPLTAATTSALRRMTTLFGFSASGSSAIVSGLPSGPNGRISPRAMGFCPCRTPTLNH